MILEDLMLDVMYSASGQRAGTEHVVTLAHVEALESRPGMERAG